MNEEQINRVMDAIDKIADKLGVAASYVLEALTKQVYVNGAVYIFLSVIFAVITAVVFFKGSKIAKVHDELNIDYNKGLKENKNTGNYYYGIPQYLPEAQNKI